MQRTITKLKETLSPLYDQRETRAVIDLILEEVCGISRIDRIMTPDRIIGKEETARVSAICQMLATGAPVQYALGYEYFMGRKFFVNKDVLIPRPETAELVEWICSTVIDDSPKSKIASSGDNLGRIEIIDIGTGSGCIALSLAALINNSHVIAADLSTGALITAKSNADNLNISNVEFVEMDILEEKEQSYQHPGVDKFDVIVSNPPYITNKEKVEMRKNVLDFEPSLALFVPDEDPLLFYRAIACFGKKNLKEGGRLFFEINAAFGKETCQLLSDVGYKEIELRKDINGRDRMILARL